MTSLSVLLLAASASTPGPPPPTDAQCHPLPAIHPSFALAPGETLEYALDALGALAGKMTMRVLPEKNGELQVQVHAQTNTFFSKIRRVDGTATASLSPRTLHPSRYVEDTTE